MLIQSAGYIGSIVSGDTNRFTFNSYGSNGAPITIVGGAIVVRNLTTGITVAGGTLTADYQSVVGLHLVEIDTSSLINFPKATEFSVELSAGLVDSISVVGRVAGQFSVAGKSDGRLYEQAVKVWAGVVTGIDAQEPNRIFTGQFTNASQVTDQYKAQVISFQPKADRTGSANQGIGRSILKSAGAGTDLVTFTCQDPFNTVIAVGDEFKILPEERGLATYTANITAEWGGVDPIPRDQYTIIWSEDGNTIDNPESKISQMNFKVWRREVGSADTLIVDENLSADANSGAYEWNETQDFITVNQGAIMRATATIDNIQNSFSRVLYNYA